MNNLCSQQYSDSFHIRPNFWREVLRLNTQNWNWIKLASTPPLPRRMVPVYLYFNACVSFDQRWKIKDNSIRSSANNIFLIRYSKYTFLRPTFSCSHLLRVRSHSWRIIHYFLIVLKRPQSITKNCCHNSVLLRKLTLIIQAIYNVITTWRCDFELVKEQSLTTNLSYHIHIAMFGNEIIVIVPGNTQGYTNSTKRDKQLINAKYPEQ